MKNKKKIIHLLNSDKFSGAENVVCQIIEETKGEYENIYVSINGDIEKVLEEKGIKFIGIKQLTRKNIRKILKEVEPDIIHAHDYTASIMSAISTTNVPIISHLHNNAPWIRKIGIYSIAYLISSFRYKSILTVSNAISQEYIFNRIIQRKTYNISNPVNTQGIIKRLDKSVMNNKHQKEFDVIFLGRLAKPKGPLRFIDIIHKIVEQKKFEQIKVIMVGDGELYKDCVNKIERLKLQNNIRLLGFLENPINILAKSKLLCMPSEWEGFGLVAIEALTLGVPVVATPVGGLTDIINEKCGKISSNNNVLVEEIIKLLNNQEYLDNKRIEAIKRVEELENKEEYFGNLMKIYND